MNTFTVKQIDAELRKLMKEKPDFVYSPKGSGRCFYNQGPAGEPDRCDGCIFGQALQNLGVPKSQLTSDACIRDFAIDFLTEGEAPKYWEQVQIHQDEGMPWGELVQFMPEA